MRRLLFTPVFYPALLLGGLLLFLLTRANVVLTAVELFSDLTTAQQFWLLCGGALCVTLGLGLTRDAQFNFAPTEEKRRELTLVALITALAFVLRVVLLEDGVHLFVHDEFWFTEGVNRFHRDPYTPLLQPFMDPTPFTGVFAFMQLLAVDAFGATLSALRLPSVLFGTATVIATYALGKQLFSVRVAVMGALLLAVFPPHIHISRLGINNIADPFFGVLALACLARGLLHDGASRMTFALGGTAMGLTFYFYDAGKLVFTPLIVGWLVCLLVARRLKCELVVPLVIFGAAALLVSLPTLYTTWTRGYLLSARLDQMGWGVRFIAEAVNMTANSPFELIGIYFERYILPVMAHFVYTVDSEPYFYGGFTAMLLPPLVPLFVGALVYLLWKWRDARSQLFLLWLLLTTLGISLVFPPTWTVRYPVIFPALALMMALVCDRVIVRFPRVDQLVVGLVTLLVIIQSVYYFGLHLPFFNQQVRPQTDYIDAMFRAAQFPRRANVFFITEDTLDIPRTWAMNDFWSRDMTVFVQPRISDFELRALPRDADLILFVEQDDAQTRRVVQLVFSEAQPLLSPYNVPLALQYVMYYVPAASEG